MAKARKRGAATIEARVRPYDWSDLRELMDNTAGWARNWDDVLRYLRGPARFDADFARAEIPALIEDIDELRRAGFRFTTDYRDLWEAITGEDISGLPEPTRVKTPPTNPIELEDRYLRGLRFPATKNDAIEVAERNHAPARVMDILQRIEDKGYTEMASLLEEIGDYAWDHD